MKSDNYFKKKVFKVLLRFFFWKKIVKIFQNVFFLLKNGNGNGVLPYPFSYSLNS